MATQNWDDHDRSDRYTALAMARNYLESCEPNAILFANGDNDTFPLWYAQEVEGIRTDVRVINITLLSSDWHIDQMARKAYDGAPIPISMNKDQYRQGTRDAIYISPDKRLDQTASYPLKDVITYITNDKNKVKLSGGMQENIIPVRKLSLKVDREKVIQSGAIAPKDTARIVDYLTWDLKGNYIFKNQLVILDILAHFNWERPIYFTVTIGRDAFFGLEKYFQQEGFTYHLVPVESSTNRYRDFGIVNTDRMYDRMMHTFQWGGYENPDLWMDENNQRFIYNIRFAFIRLAETLIQEGKHKKAEEVLDRLTQIAIHDNYAYNYSLLGVVEGYYQVGAINKATPLLDKIIDNHIQYLDYYADQSPTDLKPLGTKIEQYINVIGQGTVMISTYDPEDKERLDTYTAAYQKYTQLF